MGSLNLAVSNLMWIPSGIPVKYSLCVTFNAEQIIVFHEVFDNSVCFVLDWLYILVCENHAMYIYPVKSRWFILCLIRTNILFFKFLFLIFFIYFSHTHTCLRHDHRSIYWYHLNILSTCFGICFCFWQKFSWWVLVLYFWW